MQTPGWEDSLQLDGHPVLLVGPDFVSDQEINLERAVCAAGRCRALLREADREPPSLNLGTLGLRLDHLLQLIAECVSLEGPQRVAELDEVGTLERALLVLVVLGHLESEGGEGQDVHRLDRFVFV